MARRARGTGLAHAPPAQLRLTAALARQLAAESCLSYQDYLVLVALTGQPDGRLRLFELGRILGWEKSRLSTTSPGWPAGAWSPRSGAARSTGAFVVVTERGRKEIEAAAPGHVDAVRRLFVDVLTPEQLEAVGEAADAVLAGLDEADAG